MKRTPCPGSRKDHVKRERWRYRVQGYNTQRLPYFGGFGVQTMEHARETAMRYIGLPCIVNAITYDGRVVEVWHRFRLADDATMVKLGL